jgi:hypothetical protein
MDVHPSFFYILSIILVGTVGWVVVVWLASRMSTFVGENIFVGGKRKESVCLRVLAYRLLRNGGQAQACQVFDDLGCGYILYSFSFSFKEIRINCSIF